MNKIGSPAIAPAKPSSPSAVLSSVEVVEEKDRFTPSNIGALLSMDIKEIEWIVQGMIPVDGSAILSGIAGSGKTWIAMAIAKAVASGDPLFGKFAVKQGKVLIVDEENKYQTIVNRLRLLGISGENPIHYLVDKSVAMDAEADLLRLTALCQKEKYTLVIFDSLVRFHHGEENSAKDMARVAQAFKTIRRTGAAVLILHHHRKEQFAQSSEAGNSLRGSSEIYAAIDSHIAIHKSEDIIEVWQSKSRDSANLKPFKLKLETSDVAASLCFQGELEREKTTAEKVEIAILQLLQDDARLLRPEILEKLKSIASAYTIGKVLKAMESDGRIAIEKGQNNKYTYSLAPTLPMA